ERVGGEYFYCPHCGSELHADVNAARNIIEVQQPSTVAGRTGT
ncbi:MAG: zinc ribbon domain-containing protein, partial [Candidatus Thorarchaeota archaeon]